MDTVKPRIAVQPGDGLVGRFGDTAMVVAGLVPEEEAFVEELMGTVEACATEQRLPGTVLARRVAELVLRSGSGPVPAFGIVSPVEGGALVLLHGDATAEIQGPSGEHRLSGREAVTWVDRVLPVPFDRLSLSVTDADLGGVHPRSDLQVGVVPGAGLVLTPSGADSVRPERATEAVAGVAADDLDATEPVAAPPRPAAATMAAGALVELVGEDGSRTPLDRDYVLGREPGSDESVRTGRASPLNVDDPDQLVSRVHAHLSVDQGAVYVRDAPSANGTFVAPPDSKSWTRVGPEAKELPPGWRVRVGHQVFTVQRAG